MRLVFRSFDAYNKTVQFVTWWSTYIVAAASSYLHKYHEMIPMLQNVRCKFHLIFT